MKFCSFLLMLHTLCFKFSFFRSETTMLCKKDLKFLSSHLKSLSITGSTILGDATSLPLRILRAVTKLRRTEGFRMA